MTPLHSAPTDLATDVAAIVHEEVDRLPEKHRLPVVLCDLEGLTYEQAAGRLRWTVPTLRCRLAKARRQLDGRLDRRGITAGDVAGFLAAQAAAARAAVPTDLACSAVAAAAGGAARATAAALSAGLIRSMAMTRLKIARAGVLTAITLATAGIVAVRGLASGSGRARDGPAGRRLDETAPGRQRGPTARIGRVDRGPGPGNPPVNGHPRECDLNTPASACTHALAACGKRVSWSSLRRRAASAGRSGRPEPCRAASGSPARAPIGR